jgi:medium-chain acyl-[acyl-carrier-protein] hydrolase
MNETNMISARKLFCFHHAGGSSQIYFGWKKLLPQTMELKAIQLPGRWERYKEAPFRRIPPLIEKLVESLGPEVDGPYAVFGFSLGAIVGFEWVRALISRGYAQPVHLFVCARSGPQVPRKLSPLSNLPQEEFIQKFGERYGAIPAIILKEAEMKKNFLHYCQADFEMYENYVFEPGSLLDCPITALGGLADPVVTQGDLERWKEQTRGRFSIHMFQGDHFFLNQYKNEVFETLIREMQTV